MSEIGLKRPSPPRPSGQLELNDSHLGTLHTTGSVMESHKITIEHLRLIAERPDAGGEPEECDEWEQRWKTLEKGDDET